MSSVLPIKGHPRAVAEVREIVTALVSEYAHAIDNDELERWPQFFTERCRYQIIPRSEYREGRRIGVWFCDNRSMLVDRVSSIREVNVYEPHVYRHIVGAPNIFDFRDGAWHAETSYAVIRTMYDGTMQLISAGRYVDEIVIEEGAARFRSRIVVPDSSRFDTMLVIPL